MNNHLSIKTLDSALGNDAGGSVAAGGPGFSILKGGGLI